MKTVEKSTCGSNPSFEFDQNLAKEEIDDSLRNGMQDVYKQILAISTIWVKEIHTRCM